MERYSKRDFDRDFPRDDACLNWLVAVFYPDGIPCVKCDKVTKHYKVKSRQSYSCAVCGHHVHPMAGRIYEKTTTPLRTWFYAIFLTASTRTGVSAKWLQRQTGVTYKTAWRMFHQIRSMLDEGEPGPLRGLIEVDEKYIGGKKHGMGRGAVGKAVVVGFHERGGKIVAEVVPDVKRRTLQPVVERYVEPGSTIYTDELMTYKKLPARGFVHMSVNHKAKKWVVDGVVHVNNLEGFWGNMKRGIDGAQHKVGTRYLQQYVDEWSFRFNHRRDEMPMFWSMLYAVSA